MATTQCHKNETQISAKNWAQIFPQDQVTEFMSCLFVKKLLAVAISSITYLRAIFPEHAFGDKCLEDLNLKILRDESTCPGACQVIKWVKGCFDALEKKYLKSLVIGMYVDPNNPETMIESYTFKFSYDKDGEVDIYRNDKKISSAKSADATKSATIRLLRTLILLTNTLPSLPENVMLTMKLFYYDETPSDYEPPGFKPSDSSTYGYDEEVTNIAVGEVQTPFHLVKVRVRAGKQYFDMQKDDEEMKQHTEEVVTVTNESLDYENSQASHAAQETESEPQMKSANPEKNSIDQSDTNQKCEDNPSDVDVTDDDFKVRCPCGCNEDDGLMVMCSKCKFWQHAICFLITNEEKAPSDHYCDICAQNDSSIEPTDPYLKNLTSIAVQATCLWRRALTACTEFKRIVAPQLAKRLGIENTVAQGLINRLEKEGFLNTSGKGKKLGKTVDKERITKEGIPLYLKTPKSLSKKSIMNENMDESQVEAPEQTQKVGQQAPLEALVEDTKNMNISGKGRMRPRKSVPLKNSLKESSGRRSRKRAHSKTDDSQFEISNSQEHRSTRKKASIVRKDLAV